MKIDSKLIFAILLTSVSIYLVFVLNPEGPQRILFNLLTFAGIYGLSAIGLNIHFGWTGLLNFGHASFMGIGAYVTILPYSSRGRQRRRSYFNWASVHTCFNNWNHCCSFIWPPFRVACYSLKGRTI